MKKIVFLGSKPIGYLCFKHLIEHQTSHNFTIIGILTNNNKRFGEEYDIPQLAKKHNIPLIPSLDELMKLPDIDIMFSIQYHQILKKHHIQKANEIAINLHMAPLPEYRGCNQFSFAIINNDKTFGTTIHQIAEGIDNGPILFEKRFPMPENCFVQDLYDITFQKSLELFEENALKIIAGDYTLTNQEDLIEKRGTSLHYRKEMQALKQIDLSWPKEKIERYIRATSMPGFSPSFTFVNGKKINFSFE
ncbi:hypothetical protein BKI52_21100 [marine bacterium AO1-C]|nr:hypothetical protein BKI52_21100 [marine bacterium AO1-C]